MQCSATKFVVFTFVNATEKRPSVGSQEVQANAYILPDEWHISA